MKKIYLDNAATTPVDKEVVKIMNKFMLEKYGNPSSLHAFGREAREAVEDARKKIADFLNVKPEEIYFTSGGTESDNIAITGIALANPGKKHIITSKIEHPAVLRTCEELGGQGYRITYLGVDSEGLVNPEDVKRAITPDTLLVTVMHVNNEIGTIQPIEKIAEICREQGVLFHTDAVQSFGKIKIDASKFDLLSASGHKINAGKGIGVLYVKKGARIHPIITGGGQERRLRSGTENVPGIIGLAKAVELSEEKMKKTEKIKKMRDKLIQELEKIPGTRVNGSRKERIYSNVNVSFDDVEGESLILLLDDAGIAASTGSACSSASLKASHVLKALGLEDLQAHGSLRLTLGWENTEEEIKYVIKNVKESVETLRRISTK